MPPTDGGRGRRAVAHPRTAGLAQMPVNAALLSVQLDELYSRPMGLVGRDAQACAGLEASLASPRKTAGPTQATDLAAQAAGQLRVAYGSAPRPTVQTFRSTPSSTWMTPLHISRPPCQPDRPRLTSMTPCETLDITRDCEHLASQRQTTGMDARERRPRARDRLPSSLLDSSRSSTVGCAPPDLEHLRRPRVRTSAISGCRPECDERRTCGSRFIVERPTLVLANSRTGCARGRPRPARRDPIGGCAVADRPGRLARGRLVCTTRFRAGRPWTWRAGHRQAGDARRRNFGQRSIASDRTLHEAWSNDCPICSDEP
jgi:hypothetical protein